MYREVFVEYTLSCDTQEDMGYVEHCNVLCVVPPVEQVVFVACANACNRKIQTRAFPNIVLANNKINHYKKTLVENIR